MKSENPNPHKAMRAALERRLGEPDAPQPDRPPQVADHVLIRIIGRGAYGDVWLAHNALGRRRAVKIVYRSRFKEDRPYQRELDGILKYEPISRSHPGLVQVLQVGRDDAAACFYYVMELADPVSPSSVPSSSSGPKAADESADYAPRTLRSDLADYRRLPPAESAQLVLRLAGALGHLHAHGLVHRDIKPSNVIFVENYPKLADIGLVTDMGNSTSFVGTEGFIPPEGPGTPQADLFGLGKLLYEAATGRDRLDFPQLPPAIGGTPEGEALLDLNEVMARACAPNVRLRYPTASELEADLKLFLAGHSLRQVRSVERTLARFKRQALVASILAVAALGAFLFAQRQNHLAEARAAAEAALRTRAEGAEARARRQLHEALLEQARANSRSGELGQRIRTLDAVRRAAVIANNAELRREAFAALALPDLLLEKKIPLHQNALGWAFDPHFQRYAIGESNGPVLIRAVSDQSLLLTLPAVIARNAHVLEWSPNGRYLAVKRDLDPGGENAELEVWDLEKVERVLHAHGEPTLNAMSFHPSQARLLTGQANGQIHEWNLESARLEHKFQVPPWPFSLCYAPDGQRFAVSCSVEPDHRVGVYDAATGQLLAQKACPALVMRLDWHPRGQWIAAPDYEGNVHLIDPATGNSRLLGRHRAQGAHAAFSPDGNFLITGGWENALLCWNLQTFRRALNIDIPSYNLHFRQDGSQCAAWTQDGVQIYQFQRTSCERDLAVDLGRAVLDAAFSPNGRWLAIHGDQGIGLWNAQRSDPQPSSIIPARDSKIPLFSPDSSELYSFWEDSLGRWRLDANADTNADTAALQIQALPVSIPKGFRSASFAGRDLVLTGSNGVQLLAWPDLESSAKAKTEKAAGRGKTSPDGQWLATYKPQLPFLRILHLPDLTLSVVLTNQADVWTLAFSPRSDELAVVTRAELTFFEVGTWKITRRLNASCIRQCSVLYQPDGRSFWFTPDGRSAALYDVHSLDVLLPLPTRTIPLAVSPDGRQLAVLVDAVRVQLWDLLLTRQALRDLGVDWSQ